MSILDTDGIIRELCMAKMGGMGARGKGGEPELSGDKLEILWQSAAASSITAPRNCEAHRRLVMETRASVECAKLASGKCARA